MASVASEVTAYRLGASLAKTEIQYFRVPALGDENVGGLNIAMNDSFGMSRVDEIRRHGNNLGLESSRQVLCGPERRSNHDRFTARICHAQKEARREPWTINRNMGLLRRMLHLARKEGKLQVIPYFPMLQEAAPRDGFVNNNQFKKLLVALPVRLRPFILFLYTTGCRTGEAKQITWEQVHLDERVIRLTGTQTKNTTPRTLPLVDLLVEMLRKQKKKKGLLFPVGNFRKAWTSACIKAGLGTRVKGKENGNYGTYDGLIPHDLRRSAVRNMVRAGVSQTVAVSISGHKTIAVFQRYDITDERDRQNAMTRVGSSASRALAQSIKKCLKTQHKHTIPG